MKKLISTVALSVALLAMAVGAANAPAAGFGIAEFDGSMTKDDGTLFTQAAGHPGVMSTIVRLNTVAKEGGEAPAELAKDVFVDLPPGFVGNPTVAGTCTELELMKDLLAVCPPESQIGTVDLVLNFSEGSAIVSRFTVGLYNMETQAGMPSTFGFNVLGVSVHLDSAVRSDSDYGITIISPRINQTLPLISAGVNVWGVPAAASHDMERCNTGGCSQPVPVSMPPKALLTNTANCSAGPGVTSARADSWDNPGVFDHAGFLAHSLTDPAYPVAPSGCDKVPFSPAVEALPTSDGSEGPTGLNFSLKVPGDGLLGPSGIAQSTIKKTTVTLPEGMTINPSIGEGLGVCSEAQFGSETPTSPQGAGCPNDSKIGTVKIRAPLLDEEATGALYIAKQYDNPFDSLLAMYIVAKIPERGVVVKVAGKVTPDPGTGQLVTTFDDLPQLPFTQFDLSFREGQRSPLATPPTCGTYAIKTELVPWSASDPDNPLPTEVQTRTTEFKVTQGPNGGACSSARPFKPGLQAGSINNRGGAYSPFYVRMSRQDGEQEIVQFNADLPPGLLGRLKGVPLCSDADIAKASTKTGVQEQASPSCPRASEVGRTLAGAGVGSVLAYAPGKVYLAGPFKGTPLSIAAITSATVGPFDLGTVVVRSALKIDPDDAQVHVDSSLSDPLPRILQGIPLHLRDIRVYMDRPDFTLNPTNCSPFAVTTTLTGSGNDFASSADDVAARVDEPFQAADCATLGFKPKLSMQLLGKTNRGGHPRLRAELTARPRHANIRRAQVTLPKTEFLAQDHIKTICTRVQFAAKTCPPGSVYGYAKAWTPLLDDPVEGPVYLRSSSNRLPDLVASLDGRIHVDLVGRIDSVNARIRNTFDLVPDAPVSKFVLTMQGGKKGLLVNNTELCRARPIADVLFDAQNGKVLKDRPLVKARCGNAKKKKRK